MNFNNYLRNNYRQGMIGITFENAKLHPFYQKHWAGLNIPDSSTCVEDAIKFLDDAPPLTKEHLRLELYPVFDTDDGIIALSHTTGTTGPITYRYRTKRELEAARRIDAGSSRMPYNTSMSRPIGIELNTTFHGASLTPIIDPLTTPLFYSASIAEELLIDQAVQFLLRKFDIPGLASQASILRGPIRYIRILTQYLMDIGVKPNEMAIGAVGIYAGFATEEIRAHLRSYWGMEPFDTFSCTEVMSGALKCPKCGHLDFEPDVIPGIASFHYGKHIHEGIGMLTLTELLPWGISQPLIKYLNGDIAEWIPPDQACDNHVGGIRQIGRYSESFFATHNGSRSLLLSSNDLREAMYCPVVAKKTEAMHLTRLKDRSKLGAPIATATLDETVQPPRLEIRYKPATPNNQSNIIRERLLHFSRQLNSALDQGKVELIIVEDVELTKSLSK